MDIFRRILKEFSSCFDTLFCYFPGALGCYLRYIIYKIRFNSCGKRVYMPLGMVFKGCKNIELGENIYFGLFNKIYAESSTAEARIKIGNNVSFNSNVMINADVKGQIIIGDNVLIGPNVVIRASGHRHEDINTPIREQGHHKGKIILKEGVWVGANAVILPNVTIGRGAVVGAGAVVTKDVNAYEIAGGVPAQKIGSRLKD